MLTSSQPIYDFDGFVPYIFDNADFNTSTLTGHGTFHSLGAGTERSTRTRQPIECSDQLHYVANKNFANVLQKRYAKQAKIGLSLITIIFSLNF